MRLKNTLTIPCILVVVVLTTDVFFKWWIQANLPPITGSPYKYPYGGLGIFSNFFGIEFSLVHATNKGAAWSLFSNYQTSLLVGRIALIGCLFVYLIKAPLSLKMKSAFSLILTGAIGNVLDYFLYGHVIDMFHFIFFGYDYPVFNLADSAIFLAIVWILWLNLYVGDHQAEQKI
jgi:signal peptidase II